MARSWLLSGVVLALFLLCGCAAKEVLGPAAPVAEAVVEPSLPELVPEVVLDVPQLVSQAVPLSDAPLLGPAEQAVLHDRALERFFAPWVMVRASLTPDKAFWGVKAFGAKQGYAENLQPYPRERWERVVALQNMAGYPSMAAPGIIVRNADLRVLPSLRPFFLDPAKPGEGFPFDYFQNSALWMGTPVFITHASADRAWYFVETAFSYGWVRCEDVALAGKEFRTQYQSRVMVALRLDDTPLLAGDRFLGQAHIGAIFPLHARTGQDMSVRVPVRDAAGQAEVAFAGLSSLQASVMPLRLTSREVAGLADAMSGQLYGWGGMFGNRDCSSTMRDLLLPFGIWLPRNSSQQAQQGDTVVPFDGMAPEDKLAAIRARGVPFLSLIWMTGHIGLYLGTDARGEPLMLHNIWGVRTMLPGGGEGRAVIGRLVVSTLRPGEERGDVRRGAFLERVRGVSILGAGVASGGK